MRLDDPSPVRLRGSMGIGRTLWLSALALSALALAPCLGPVREESGVRRTEAPRRPAPQDEALVVERDLGHLMRGYEAAFKLRSLNTGVTVVYNEPLAHEWVSPAS